MSARAGTVLTLPRPSGVVDRAPQSSPRILRAAEAPAVGQAARSPTQAARPARAVPATCSIDGVPLRFDVPPQETGGRGSGSNNTDAATPEDDDEDANVLSPAALATLATAVARAYGAAPVSSPPLPAPRRTPHAVVAGVVAVVAPPQLRPFSHAAVGDVAAAPRVECRVEACSPELSNATAAGFGAAVPAAVPPLLAPPSLSAGPLPAAGRVRLQPYKDAPLRSSASTTSTSVGELRVPPLHMQAVTRSSARLPHSALSPTAAAPPEALSTAAIAASPRAAALVSRLDAISAALDALALAPSL